MYNTAKKSLTMMVYTIALLCLLIGIILIVCDMALATTAPFADFFFPIITGNSIYQSKSMWETICTTNFLPPVHALTTVINKCEDMIVTAFSYILGTSRLVNGFSVYLLFIVKGVSHLFLAGLVWGTLGVTFLQIGSLTNRIKISSD